MKIKSIHVINVIIILPTRIIFRNIISLNMELVLSNICVIIVMHNLHKSLMFRDIFRLYMRV